MLEYFLIAGMVFVLAASFIFVRVKIGGRPGLITKTNASIGFVVAAMYGIMTNGYTDAFGFIVLGLVFGLVGDILLELKVIDSKYDSYYTNAGTAVFGVGHLMYFCAILLLSNSVSLLVPILASAGIAIAVASLIMWVLPKPLKLNFGKYFWQSYAYSLLLVFMTVLSIWLAFFVPNLWIMAVGLGLFFVSDLILSTQYYGSGLSNKFLIITNHAAYYLAQIFIFTVIYFI